MSAVWAIAKLALGGAGRFLRSLPWQAYAVLGALLLCWGGWHMHARAVKQAYDTGFGMGEWTVQDQVAAEQAVADTKARAAVAKTVAKQDAIAKETSDALYKTTDAIDARAHALSVRHDAWAANQPAAVPGNQNAAGEAAGQSCPSPAGDGLPWSVALPLMTQAQKDLAQLNAILDFEEAQDALAATEGTGIASPTAK